MNFEDTLFDSLARFLLERQNFLPTESIDVMIMALRHGIMAKAAEIALFTYACIYRPRATIDQFKEFAKKHQEEHFTSTHFDIDSATENAVRELVKKGILKEGQDKIIFSQDPSQLVEEANQTLKNIVDKTDPKLFEQLSSLLASEPQEESYYQLKKMTRSELTDHFLDAASTFIENLIDTEKHREIYMITRGLQWLRSYQVTQKNTWTKNEIMLEKLKKISKLMPKTKVTFNICVDFVCDIVPFDKGDKIDKRQLQVFYFQMYQILKEMGFILRHIEDQAIPWSSIGLIGPQSYFYIPTDERISEDYYWATEYPVRSNRLAERMKRMIEFFQKNRIMLSEDETFTLMKDLCKKTYQDDEEQRNGK